MPTNGGGSQFLRPRRWVWPLSLLIVVVVFWSVFLGQAEKSVFGRVPILDEVYFLDRAGDPGSEPYFVSPLYPRLIGMTGSGGHEPADRVFEPAELRGIRIFQIGCWLGVIILLRLIAGRAGGPDPSSGWKREFWLWLPSILFAFYRPAAVYTVSVLLELPLLFLVTLGVYLLTRLRDENEATAGLGWMVFAALGMVTGMAALLRGTALLLLIPAIWLAIRGARGGRDRGIRILVLAGACAMMLAPPVLHNSRQAGRLVGPTLNAGVNFYIGNGPDANGFYVAAVPGDWRHDPAGRRYLAERLEILPPSLAEADSIWAREAWLVIRDHPVRTVGLWWKKVWLHLQGWEIDQLTPLARWRQAAPALTWMVVPYALLVVLGAAGLVGTWSRTSVRRWGAVLAVLVAGQSVFFVVSRYRLVLVPILCLLAVVGLREILRRSRPAMVAACLAALVVIPWGLASTRDMWRSQAVANEALRWAEIATATDGAEARQNAENLYRESVAGRPAGPAPWLGLAALLVQRGDIEEATHILEEGAAAAVRNLEINRSLLALLLEQGRQPEALDLTARILADHPRDADTLHNRAVLLAENNRADEAKAVSLALIDAHPSDVRGYIDLGVILARSGRRDEARVVFQQGLKVLPDHPQLQQNLELLDR